MKLLLSFVLLIGLSGCSSLVTRADFNGCVKKCGSPSEVDRCTKFGGQMICICK